VDDDRRERERERERETEEGTRKRKRRRRTHLLLLLSPLRLFLLTSLLALRVGENYRHCVRWPLR